MFCHSQGGGKNVHHLTRATWVVLPAFFMRLVKKGDGLFSREIGVSEIGEPQSYSRLDHISDFHCSHNRSHPVGVPHQ